MKSIKIKNLVGDKMPKVAFVIAAVLALFLIIGGQPWLALVAFVGPVLAWGLTILGISGAGILTVLSGGGTFPMVAGVGFLITFALAIYSYFM